MKLASQVPLAVDHRCDQYLQPLVTAGQRLATVNRLAAANELPDAIITTASGLKVAARCGGA
jgi:hypothetical protein